MFFEVELPGPDVERASSHENLPSLPSARFRKGRGIGFIQVVNEASHSRRHLNHLPDATPTESFALRGSESLPNLNKDPHRDRSLDRKESLSVVWSRNISKLKNIHSGGEGRPRDKWDLPLAGAAKGKRFSFQRSQDSKEVPAEDVITGKGSFSELVVDLTSRESSPMTRVLQELIPGVKNYRSRSLLSRGRSGHAPPAFPQINNGENAGNSKSRVPKDPAERKRSFFRNTEFALQEIRRLQECSRTPRGSWHPRRDGDLSSPALTRTPRSSLSRTPLSVEMFEVEGSVTGSASTIDSQDSEKPPDMGMGTLLSFYPRENSMGAGAVPYEYEDVSKPLVPPLEAWSSSDQNSDISQWSDDDDLASPYAKQNDMPFRVSWTVMMDVGVQTTCFSEEELDWDLSDHVDRETQTLPPNPTPFQLNRTDVFVQTDYRYFPLAVPRPHTSGVFVKKVDASTQTEHTTSSVSTQTEEPYLQPYVPPVQKLEMGGASFDDDISVLHSDASSGPSTSGLGSAIQRPAILQPLPGSLEEPDVSILPPSPPHSPEVEAMMNSEGEQLPLAPLTAEDRWSKLALQTIHEFMPIAIKKKKGLVFNKIPFFKIHRTRRRMIDVSIQTDNDILTDEAPKFAARPPPCRKVNLLEDTDFSDIDEYVLNTPDTIGQDSSELVRYLCLPATDDLERLRAIFRWVTENISFDWKYVDESQTVDEILESRAGVSKDYVVIMVELCHLAGIRVKKIQGFARPHDFRIGTVFVPDNDPLHTWSAVFLFGSWRLISLFFFPGHMDAHGKYHRHLKEHYFLTDPDQMIFTHFPYHNMELDYDRWQLLDRPLTLEEFNSLPKVMPEFWACRLRLDRPKSSPVTFKTQTEITLSSNVLIRYKYRFFPADDEEGEDASINQWVFCTMKDNDATVSFMIQPPEADSYILKIYAGVEEFLEDEGAALPHVVTFLLHCEKCRRYAVPWPLHDVAWGPTQRLYECAWTQSIRRIAVITTWGGRKSLIFDKAFEVLAMFQIFDCDGQQLEPKGILGREETEDQLRLTIVPPGCGYYKLLIYGIPRPQVGGSVVRGRWSLPLLASYLIECKMVLESKNHDRNPEKKKNGKRKIRVNSRR
ncbi:uncharacterized protein LOC135209071 [Macrobrachium nipponense]|uniref:uncharacterized protein LOC135209071 n=1 Tax=Macrobrachium nipponense TaxID=159736 RepID=UPI0030C89B98